MGLPSVRMLAGMGELAAVVAQARRLREERTDFAGTWGYRARLEIMRRATP